MKKKSENSNPKLTPKDFFEIFGELPVPMPRSCIQKEKRDGSKVQMKGRPTNYEPVTVRAILRDVAMGLPTKTASTLAGIQESEVYRWMDQFPDFRECITHARSICEKALLSSALHGIVKQPRLALDLLERRFANSWAPAKIVRHTGFIAHAAIGEINLQALAEDRRKKDEIILQAETTEAQQIEAGTPHVVVDSCKSENQQNDSVAIPVEHAVSEQPAEA